MSSAQLVFKRYETKYLLDAERPAYEEKTRTCRYGTPHPFDPVFVELKKKCDGVVYRRRCGADSVRGGWGVPYVMGSLVYSGVDRAQAGDGIAAGQLQGAGQPQQPGAAGGLAGPK